MRRNLVLLQRDEADLALVAFYGKLAQGMTRDTFIGCEGSSLLPVDEFGRQMFLGEGLDRDTTSAAYPDGVLTVTIPVAEEAKPRRVEITTRAADVAQPVIAGSVAE